MKVIVKAGQPFDEWNDEFNNNIRSGTVAYFEKHMEEACYEKDDYLCVK